MANEDKSVRYHRLRRRAALIGSAWQVGLLLTLVASGGAVAMRETLSRLVGSSLVPLVVVYVLALVALSEAVQLPLAFYREVTLERRYGLSTEPVARWWAGRTKTTAVLLVGLVAAALLVLSLLRWSPGGWWLASALSFAALLAVLTQLLPVLLLPLFHVVRPLGSAALRERLLALARRAGAPAVGVFEWRVGTGTRKANAALVGLGPTRRILISDTLLADHSDEEVEAVLAHELAHHVHGDIWTALVVESILVAVGCYLADLVLSSSVDFFGFDGKADVAALPLLVLTGGVVSFTLKPAVNALSRAHERRADRFALDTTRNPPAFISAMKRLAARNLAEERPSVLVELLFHTHPAIEARIAAARAWDPSDLS